jgi:arsenite-transporting ATPase
MALSTPTCAARIQADVWTFCSTRFSFTTGKGGVGKTTIAAASAVHLADGGARVLLVSTDPASNLSDVLGTATGRHAPVPVADVPGLDVLDLDPQTAAQEYRERALAPYRDVLPPEELETFTEQLAGACTVEVAAFDTFARLLTDEPLRERYDHIVFDTAPTGHTLRLLALPAAWSSYLSEAPDDANCLGPLANMAAQQGMYQRAVAALADPELTSVVLVARPDRGSLLEAARAAGELAGLGIGRASLVVNGVLTDPAPDDPVAQSFARAQTAALSNLPPPLRELPGASLPLVAFDVTGIPALRTLTQPQPAPKQAPRAETTQAAPALPGFADLVSTLAAGPARAVLVTGKGGVGKTTVATRLAVALAARGLPVHLSTTDPAGHLPELDAAPASLTVSRIDPAAETNAYTEARMAAARDLDEHQRDLLVEELHSPCTTELAVFKAFSHLLVLARQQFVIIDTAPSGHTLLLLDLTGAYHQQAMQQLGGRAARAVTPLMRLQDPTFSRLLIVTLAETTPVAEAAELQDDLRRADVEPFGWVVNATLAGSGTQDPLLARRAALEDRHLARVRDELAARTWVTPWQPTDEQVHPG